MVRLSDILRKEEISRVSFDEHKAVASSKTTQGIAVLSAENIYRELLGLARIVLGNILNQEPFNIYSVKERINLLIECILSDESDLFRLVDCYDVKEDYLVIHSVNVCILSLEIAKGLKYKKEQLLDLGMGAFLHDIGMIKVKSILDKERRLYNAEYEEVKNHVDYGVKILENLEGINENIFAIVREHHERIDGSGYLQGLASGSIHEYARIVGLADVYEALIHSRPHRNKLIPFEYETIKEIIMNRQIFDPYILRVFIECMTKHPAYMLWLTTAGVYQILQQRKSPPQENILDKIGEKKIHKRRKLLFATLLIFITLTAVLIFNPNRPHKEIFYPLGESLYLAQNKVPLKIAYDFTNNITDTYSVSLDLSGIDLERYYFLAFLAKIDDPSIPNTGGDIKIEIENSRKEKSEYYLQDVNNSWREFIIPLSYFDKISDWSEVDRIYFGLQPWNINSKKGTVYIDEMRFLKKK